MAYGFGARTFLNDDGPACNLFSMTGDFMSPYVDNIADNYRKTLKNVKLSLPVMYKNIIKIVCDLAKDELGSESSEEPLEDIRKVKNYYVLTLVMAGMIDDFKDALNEMLRAANLPISIIVVKIGKNSEENDSEKFVKQCNVAFNSCERVFLDIVDFENYKNEKGEHSVFCAQQLEYDLIKSIPRQIEKFFEMKKFEMESEQFTNQKLEKALQESLILKT